MTEWKRVVDVESLLFTESTEVCKTEGPVRRFSTMAMVHVLSGGTQVESDP